ncbi:MAG: hypothetical protein FWD73_07000 [Polyangiaceae bacterium]|nr:hypothetical protein [Polyangiaceae bacterium]
MIYATIDVTIIMHEKALLAGVEAFGLWSWGLAYVQRYQTDGRLTVAAVRSALGGNPRRNERLGERLVQVGLWSRNEDGSFQVVIP